MNINAIVHELIVPLFIASAFFGLILPLYFYSRQQKQIFKEHEKQNKLMFDLRDRLYNIISHNLSLEIIKIEGAANDAKEMLQSYKDELFDEYIHYETLHLGIMYLNKNQYSKAAKQFLLSAAGWSKNGDTVNAMFSLNLLSLVLPKISGSGFRFIEKSLDKEDVYLDAIFAFLLRDELKGRNHNTIISIRKSVENKRNEMFVN